ncbi:hypothetical protein BV908_19635 [Diaphorobacter sp. LR2014-1]|nr:hypothetical protein BV908_19635 [Diaphorobacter sp. LR2014-1]
MRPKWAGGPANRPDGPLQSLRRRVWAARVFALSVPDAFEKHFFNGLLTPGSHEAGCRIDGATASIHQSYTLDLRKHLIAHD